MNVKKSTSFKLFFVGFLVILLLIPAMMIKGLISERESRANSVLYEISNKWGKSQKISGPILTVPYREYTFDRYGKRAGHYDRTAYILPDDLKIEGSIDPQVRRRGIFEAILYTADIKLTGSFNLDEITIPGANEILWSNSLLSIELPDMRGLKEVPQVNWNGSSYDLEPGLSSFFENGLGRYMQINEVNKKTFEVSLKVNGSENLSFIPMGSTTEAHLKSSWANPSFNGAFLPDEHTISDENGFEASWKILEVNRNFPQVWNYETQSTYESEFGLKLIKPVDTYQQVERSVKYAILFIFLTFLSYFLVEILNRYQIHPIQYLLVGFAIVLFYLLLLSLSEHINFNVAYLIASIGVVGMVSLYSAAILHKKRMGTILGAILSGLYIYLYILLQAEDYALLIGSLGLFVILGAVMYLTRKVDWYKIGE